MKTNPEQDADSAAMQEAINASLNCDSYESAATFIWQAAKADSSAMQTATIGSDNTQTVYNLLEERKAMQGALERIVDTMNVLHGGLLCLRSIETDESIVMHMRSYIEHAESALSLAAPFRKTGVNHG